MIVLGIDPGSRVTGYGVIDASSGNERLIEFGVLKLDEQKDHPLRLRQIHERMLAVIERTLPDVCAVEMPVYARNAQSMLKLGRAQAAAMLAALNRNVPVTEYTPKEIKKSVTGTGNASKEQVWYMVRTILKLEESEVAATLDASDALAVSLCHAHRVANRGSGRGAVGGPAANWAQFVKDNPDRVR